jgi:L-fucose isomerase-like protein
MPSSTPTVAMVATARPTFAVDVAARLAAQARDLLTELGADVVGPDGLVLTPDDVSTAAAAIGPALADADLVVHVCASFSDASPGLALYQDLDRPVLLWSFREPGEDGDRLWLNSMCGANLLGHALTRAGGAVRHLHGNTDEPRVRDALSRALAGELPPAASLPANQGTRAELGDTRQALDRLDGRTLGVIGDAPPGFTPSEYDAELLRKTFGIRVLGMEVDEVFDRVRRGDADAAERERLDAVTAQPSLTGVAGEQVRLHAAVTTALRGWTEQEQLDAVAVRCWPEFPTQLGVCPCSSLSRLADAGTPTTCERDVYGAVTMLLLEALGSGPTYLVDTVDLDEDQDVVRLWHCGSAATSLAADPSRATQSVHCNRKIGVAGDFPLRPGPVVLARLTENPHGSGLRLLIAHGESLEAPNRFQGNTATVRLDTDAADFVNGLVTGGFPHHTVLAWTDVRPALRTAADLLGIPVVEW